MRGLGERGAKYEPRARAEIASHYSRIHSPGKKNAEKLRLFYKIV